MTHGDDRTRDAAVELLRRRELSAAELACALRDEGHDETSVAETLERLVAAGYIDDDRLALNVVLRRSRRGRAPADTTQDLRRRGIAEEAIGRAWERARRDHDLDPSGALVRALRERTRGATLPLDGREARRVYNALLRAGFEDEEVRSHLEPLLREPGDEDMTGFDDAAPADPREPSDHARADDDLQ